MSTLIHAQVFNREGLTTGFVNAGRTLEERRLSDLIDSRIPDRGAIIGKWRRDADPFPDILIVRDDDLSDTHAWLSSYFTALSPISQWCRIIPQSQVARLVDRRERPYLDGRLGGWIGAILAECSAQAGQNINLKELPGTAALASSTFAAARGVAVWGDQCDLREISIRHDELSSKLRESSRPISGSQVLPIWETLNGYFDPTAKTTDRRALAPFAVLFDRILSQSSLNAESIGEVVSVAVDHFRIPEIADCSRGPQLERVRALDQLIQALAQETKVASTEALVGFAASLVDPGMAVLPDLLRKYSGRFPMAPLWLGAFAGCWSPARVLSDHSGLGRLVTKALLSESDLEEKPQCDIAYDEISRWINGVTASKLPLRGMAARSLSIEIALGVTCPFATGRADVARSEANAAAQRRDDQAQALSESQRSKVSSNQVAFLSRSLDTLTKRVDHIERYISTDMEMKRKLAAESSQRDLLSGLKSDPEAPRPSKKR